MKNSNFELLFINYAEEKATITEFLNKVDVKFPVLLDEKGRTAASWNTIALPSTFIIGPDGKIAYGVNAAIEWDSQEVVNTLKKLAGQ
jgi:peroxiredoxin